MVFTFIITILYRLLKDTLLSFNRYIVSKEKLPKLNNGHLEPAITVSLGPNDIYARFAKKIDKFTFLKFRVNPDSKTDWVVGSNYYEPSYCLHTYSRATNGREKFYLTLQHQIQRSYLIVNLMRILSIHLASLSIQISLIDLFYIKIY